MRKKILLAIIFMVPFILLIPTFLYFSDNSIVLFPNPEYTSRIEATASQNSSTEIAYPDSETMSVTYQLQSRENGGDNPYCGIVFWLTKEQVFLNLSDYDYLSLNVLHTTAKKVVLFLKTFEPGVSRPEKEAAFYLRHNEYTLILNPGSREYNISLSDFIVPDWWFDSMDIPKTENLRKTFTQSVALDFQFIHRDKGPLPEDEQLFILKSVVFHKRYPLLLIILNITTGLYLFLLLRLFFIKKKLPFSLSKVDNPSAIDNINYKPLELENFKTREYELFMKYVEEHYFNPRLSISLISSETGISQPHIRNLVREHFHCTCRELINRIRINEAKRLLKATDRRVVEIALSVGFKDISTFNRYFKQQEGIPPTDYRNK